jgi:hypothetical protein
MLPLPARQWTEGVFAANPKRSAGFINLLRGPYDLGIYAVCFSLIGIDR